MTTPRQHTKTHPGDASELARFNAIYAVATDPQDQQQRFAKRLRIADNAAHLLIRTTPSPGSAFVTGPSGAGKSLIIKRLSEALPNAVRVEQLSLPTESCAIDLIDLPQDQAGALLARAGLAEASTFLTPCDCLSEGERARLRFALACAQATKNNHADLIADEFLSTLDEETARSTARSIKPMLTAMSLRLFAASARDATLGELRPDTMLYQPFHGLPELHTRETHAHTDTTSA